MPIDDGGNEGGGCIVVDWGTAGDGGDGMSKMFYVCFGLTSKAVLPKVQMQWFDPVLENLC